MSEIKQVFSSNHVVLTDKSEFWDVITQGGERIASFENEFDADELAKNLNLVITDAANKKGAAINEY